MLDLVLKKIKDISEVISPISFIEFKRDYWEKDALVVQRNDESYYNSLFCFDEFDGIINHSIPNGDAISVVRNSGEFEKKNSKELQKPDGRININQLYALYADGYSIVVNGVHHYDKKINNLINHLRIELSSNIGANMYLTPSNQKAFSPHYDSHDVLILQLSGEKKWNLYENTNFKTPVVNSHQPNFKKEQLTLTKEITLKSGDFMYIPRGMPHDAYTEENSSLHITIGVYPIQWMDFFQKFIQTVAFSELELRKSLPLGFLNSNSYSEVTDNLEKNSNVLKDHLMSKKHLDATLQLIFDEQRKELETNSDSNFMNIDQMNDVDQDTVLVQRENMNCKVYNDGLSSQIAFAGNSIKGPYSLLSTFQFIASQENEFLIKDIPNVSDKNKIKITQRLVRGGLLRIINK